MHTQSFDENMVLHDLHHYLPSQLSLKDFVHHNPLHNFQNLSFFDAIFKASKNFGCQVTLALEEYKALHQQGRIRDEILSFIIVDQLGESKLSSWRHRVLHKDYPYSFEPKIGSIRSFWKKAYQIDLDNLVHPLLFRYIGSFLDQGIALWHFPFEDKGLLQAIRDLDSNSFQGVFKSKRTRELLHQSNLNIKELLDLVVGNPKAYSNYLFDQQFAHRGWSGLIAATETTPETLFYRKKSSLKDLILFELLLEIDALDSTLGRYWKPLGEVVQLPNVHYFDHHQLTELETVLSIWQRAFEWDYYDEVLAGIQTASRAPKKDSNPVSFQSVFCIDDRECSIRRHFEQVDKKCQTFGAPGFFGAAFYFQPQGGKFYEKNCPVPVTPKHLIKEYDVKDKRKHELLHHPRTHTGISGFLVALSVGLWAAVRMVYDLFFPKMRPDIANAFAHMNRYGKLKIENESLDDIENGLQVGYTLEEMTDVVEGILKGIGLTKDFAPIVYMVAHGSSSANNPHHGAHDCGACSGRPGAVNARVFAFMANHSKVRSLLESKGISIPSNTWFVGAMHDTASDEIEYYDIQDLNEEFLKHHLENVPSIELALDFNAKERSRRFASIDTQADLKSIRKAIKNRSVSYFEPRPELGHGTNSICLVGNRETTKSLVLDRRAFLQSYNPSSDPDGNILAKILGPLPVVCGGINLEYYFSRMDVERMGAGTKLPHHVMGLVGVSNSSDGDLRPGLPLQMIENHDPIRLMMIIEQSPAIVENILNNTPAMKEWFSNEWIFLFALNPLDYTLYRYKVDQFYPYSTLKKIEAQKGDFIKQVEQFDSMKTNHILDATKENLPVYVYEHE